MIRLFDIDNRKVKATIHCYNIKVLKEIMDKYPKEHLNIYKYLFYMSCLNEDENPFANSPEADREDLVLREIDGEVNIDDPLISKALKTCQKLYETPSYNFYISVKTAIENLAHYLRTTPITDGRDGNVTAIQKAIEKFNDMRTSYKETEKDFKQEQQTLSRGGERIAYDQ